MNSFKNTGNKGLKEFKAKQNITRFPKFPLYITFFENWKTFLIVMM